MSSKKITRWIDLNHHKTCVKIIKNYYVPQEEGMKVNLMGKRFLILFMKRFFFIFLNLFRFNRNPYAKYFKDKSPRVFFRRLLGLYKLEVPGLLAPPAKLEPIHFPAETDPLVTIIIAVHNHLNYTYNCLRSIAMNTGDVSYEVLVINDCSVDQTKDYLKTVENISYIENTVNLGFLKSCNKAAGLARGKYICLLNNDTQVGQQWLANLLAPFRNDPETGLVGARLIYPYGLLQEAGGLINHHGTPSNYGKYELPDQNKYNYLRETDYCSGAAILFTKADFSQLGGFDERYAPAYYEDTDLCMAIRYQLHKKVYYQPLSQIIHFEGVSSGKTIVKDSIKSYQEINARKFKEKWATALQSFPVTNTELETAEKFRKKRTILLVDCSLPAYDKGSGYKRMFELIQIFKSLDFNIMFLAQDNQNTEPYFSALINLGVEIIYSIPFGNDVKTELNNLLYKITYAWISRPELNEYYETSIRKNPAIIWIYDTVDLHFIREERGLKLQNALTHEAKIRIDAVMQKEVRLAKEADITIAITETEKEILDEKGAKNVIVIPNVHTPYTGPRKRFDEREGLCFIGGYAHSPNVDAVCWLAEEIMPLVWESHPHITLTLIGSQPTPAVMALQSSKIQVTGYVEDVTQYFTSSRICVAPLRYGAGMKGKVGQSLEFGLPVVTTDIGAEGMDLQHGLHVLIANDAETFAKEIIRLYDDEALWNQLSSRSIEAIEKYAPYDIARKLQSILPSPKNAD